MDNIVRPTSAQADDAIAEQGEYQDLLAAMTAQGQALAPEKIKAVLAAVDRALRDQFQNPPLDLALAAIATVAGNQLASMVMQVQRANPIGDAGRDGRVRAVSTFLTKLFERSVDERVMAGRMDVVAAQQFKKINARLQ